MQVRGLLLGGVGLAAAAALSLHGASAALPPAGVLSRDGLVSSPNPAPGPQPRMPRHSQSSLSPRAALTPGGTWSWQNPLPEGNPLFGISCPTVTACFAAGMDSPILSTTNGGGTWVQGPRASGVNAISCPSASVCVAVGDFGHVLTTSDGVHWTSQNTNGGNFLAGVSCPSITTCFAVGALGSVLISTNGGVSWSSQTSGVSTDLLGVSCPSASICYAVGPGGVIAKTSNGGTAWSHQLQGWNFTGISCATTIACGASSLGISGFGGVISQTYDGTSWSNGGFQGADLSGISCPSVDFFGLHCFATGYDGNVYFAAGSASTGASGALFAISCPTTQVCVADGDFGTVVQTSVGGSTWKKQSPGLFFNYTTISCPNTTDCYALGSGYQFAATKDGGATWQQQFGPFSAISSVSCPSATTCFAGGYGGLFLNTTDGGATWVSQGSANVFGMSCPTVLVCYGVGYYNLAKTVDGGATWAQSTLSPGFPYLTSISCPSTTICFAAGTNVIYATTDGTTWASNFAFTGATLAAISCPSTTTCFAVGPSRIYATINGGASWSDESNGTTENFLSISCPSTTVCFATSTLGDVVGTTNGTTWTVQSVPGVPFIDLNAVSCPTTTTCFAAAGGGGIIRTTDGGATKWRLLAPSGTQSSVLAVSCATSTTCYAMSLNAAVLKTTDGASWFATGATGLFQNASPASISCPSTTVCFAVNNQCCAPITSTTDGGTTWATATPLGDTTTGFVSVSCASTVSCVAVASNGTFTETSDGSHWGALASIGSATASAVSCPSTSVCYATDGGGKVFTTPDAGAHWNLSFDLSADPQAGGTGPFKAVNCMLANECFAVGANGLVATTTDGTHWRTDNVPSRATLTAISCPTTSSCFAVTNNGVVLRTTDFGRDWEAQDAAADNVPSGNFSGISCPSATACFAVGDLGTIVATTNGGAAWSGLLPVGATSAVRSLSCTSSTDCYAAAGQKFLVTHDGGSTWAATDINGTDFVEGISCPTTNTCFATGWPGAIYHTADGGTTWNYESSFLSGSDQTLRGVSCFTATNCVAVGTQGTIVATSDGINWSAMSSGTTQFMTAVSCSTATDCVAVGVGGLTLVGVGTSWKIRPSGTTQDLLGVSCPSFGYCYAAGAGGTILTTSSGGVFWAAQSSGVTSVLAGISCQRTFACVAVGDFGVVLVTLDGSTWSLQAAVPTFNALRAAAFVDLQHVWAGGFGGTILADSNLTVACTSASVAPDVASPISAGTIVHWTASATGCKNPVFEFFVQDPSANWTLGQAFSSNNVWAWNTAGLGIGNYTVHVWANQAGDSTSTYEALAGGTMTITACVSAALSPSYVTQQVATTVNLTASSSGCPNPEYEFWAQYPDGSWNLKQPWGGATFAWDTTGLVPGTYTVHVWANQTGIGHDSVGSATVLLTGCATAGVAPPTASQLAGTTVSLTGTSTGCLAPRYEWWVQYPNGTWYLKQGFPSATFNWDTTGLPPGLYTVHDWVNTTGTGHDAVGSATVTLTGCTSANASPNPASPQTIGTSIVFTASSVGCSSPVYQFFLLDPLGVWHLERSWSATPTWTWNSSGWPAGTYTIHVWANQSGADLSTFEANGGPNFMLTTPPPCTGAALTPSTVSQAAGTTVALTASSSGCTNPQYEFWVQYPDLSWNLKQGFSSTASFNWDTTGLVPGTYTVHAWASATGVGHDSVGSATVTLTGCSSASVSPPSGTGPVGTKPTFTASAMGCPTPVFEFWLQYPDGSWHLEQGFSTTATWQWDSTGLPKGTYTIHVWADNQGSDTSHYQTIGTATFSLT